MTAPLMARAIALAIDSARSGGGPFAALVVRGGEVLAEAQNRVTAWNDPTAHAEIVAIREACRTLGRFRLDGCEVYATCEPCPMCLGAIYWARAERVYFAATRADAAAAGFDDAALYAELARDLDARRIPMVPLLREEALAPFRAWTANPTRVEY